MLHFTYCFYRNFECHPHAALIPQLIPYMTTLGTFLVDKKESRTKKIAHKMSQRKNIGIHNLKPLFFVALVFFTYGSLPNAQNLWCLLLGVGALHLASLSKI
jgi:hypothetical protein